MRVVLSQSMYFPWAGMLEQMRLAELYLRYDDVQFSKGSFTNRVQVKTATGSNWLTVPLRNARLGQRIDETETDEQTDWRSRHRGILRQAYLNAPFREEMLALVDSVFAQPARTVADVSYASMLALAGYFGIGVQARDSAGLGIGGSGSRRVLDIVRAVGGTTYITGHGARNYLDHEIFETAGIAVEYMQYQCIPYPQLHGEFTPYVSALDLLANCGREGQQVIQSQTINWRKFINGSA